MKKIIIFILSCVLCFFATGCDKKTEIVNTDPQIVEQAKNDLKIDLTEEINVITKNFTLVSSINGVLIDWESDSDSIEIIKNNTIISAKVTRSVGADIAVKLKATLKLNDISANKEFNLTVKGITAELGSGINGVKTTGFDIGTDNGKQFGESLKGGYQYVYFNNVEGEDFYFKTDVTALATYNILTDNVFGIILENRFGKILFYVDAGNGLTNSRCGYALYSDSEWDYTARKKTVDINYRNGNSVELSALKDGDKVYFLIDGEAVFFFDNLEFIANGYVDAGFLTKDVHAAFYNFDYTDSNLEEISKNIDKENISILSEDFINNLVSGFELSFASPEDALNDSADDIHVKFERDEIGFSINMVGIGVFESSELITAVIHTSQTSGASWGLDKTDEIIKITSDGNVYIKTGISDFWQWRLPSDSDTKLTTKAVIEQYDYYFTVKITVKYSNLQLIKSDTIFKIMFSEGFKTGSDLSIYNASPFTSNMRLKKIATGDPAYQISYVTVSTDGTISK
jgi:hypothetical protein